MKVDEVRTHRIQSDWAKRNQHNRDQDTIKGEVSGQRTQQI